MVPESDSHANTSGSMHEFTWMLDDIYVGCC